jgi:centromere protein C
MTLVPHIKEIRRVPKDVVMPLSKATRKRAPRSKSRTVEEEFVFNPEEGWDDNTDQQGVVIDFVTKEEVQRRQCLVYYALMEYLMSPFSGIAFTAKMVEPQAAANNDWFFQKVFGDGDFIAAGQLIIPPKGRKPSKGTKDNTYVSDGLNYCPRHLIDV